MLYRADMTIARDDELFLTLAGGAKALVPADLRVLSCFVFLEQEDWFEAEAGFARSLAGHVRAALDVGANFGFYASTLAAGGASVLAFEPHPELAEKLRRAFAGGRARVVEAACGAETGTMRFGGHAHVEGSRRAADGAFTVPIGRLDDLVPRDVAAALDFVKIDVEGGEVAAIAGGAKSLRASEPLVMVEIKDGPEYDFAALDALAALGMARYRLLPGADLLIPMGAGADSANQINAFAATPARAAALAKAGLLAAPISDDALDAPYALWDRARDSRRDAGLRAGDLLRCFDAFARLRETAPSLEADLGFARLAKETGRDLLGALALHRHLDGPIAVPRDRFLWPLARYENLVDVDPALALRAGVTEAYHALLAPSSLFADPAGREVALSFAIEAGVAAPETLRRLYLYRLAMGRKADTAPHPLLSWPGPDNLNPDFWRRPALYG
jgi:FkbM family methyltransferase